MKWILLACLTLLPVWQQLAWGALPREDEKNPERSIHVPGPADGRGTEELPVDPFGSEIVFKNGDRLHGALVSVKADGALVWARPDAEAPIAFKLDNLYGIKLERGQPREKTTQQTRIHLTNGDALTGEIIKLDAQHLTLDTWYGGELLIKRQMIAAVHPPNKSEAALIYSGPTDMSEWEAVNGEWQVRGGELIGYGQVGANVQLPDLARLRFEVNWPGRYSNFAIALYVNDYKNFNQDSYYLSFTSNRVGLRRHTRDHGMLNLGQVQVPYLVSRSKAWMEILVNREASTIALLVNDQLIKEWNDPQGFVSAGSKIIFRCHDRGAPISFSDITVSEWDGKLGSVGDLKAHEQDVIQFINFDRITGNLKAIDGQHLAFQTPYATMDIPLPRVKTLALGQAQAQRARRYAHDVELYFADGERLTIRLNRIENGTLTGYTETIGDVTLDMTAFHGMRLNIYDDDLPAEDETELFDQGNFRGFVSDW